MHQLITPVYTSQYKHNGGNLRLQVASIAFALRYIGVTENK